MNGKSEEMIREHELLEPHESDKSSRENAAALLWATEDQESMNAAEKIWRELKTPPTTINALKNLMLRLKEA
jgi:hypothetical protein